jgi:hypothetical protein
VGRRVEPAGGVGGPPAADRRPRGAEQVGEIGFGEAPSAAAEGAQAETLQTSSGDRRASGENPTEFREARRQDGYSKSNPTGRAGSCSSNGPVSAPPTSALRSQRRGLAAVPTRLERVPDDLQERIINWGYAVCDAALRKHDPPPESPLPASLTSGASERPGGGGRQRSQARTGSTTLRIRPASWVRTTASRGTTSTATFWTNAASSWNLSGIVRVTRLTNSFRLIR